LSSEPAAPAARPGLARNAFHLGVGQIATTVLTMLLSAALARTLGAAEFGLLYLLNSIATFAYVFVDWGHGPYVTREIARHPERAGELMGSVLVVRFATAALMCGIAVSLTWMLGYEPRTRVYAALMILSWLPQFLALTYAWAFRGRERMEYDARIQMVLKFSHLVIAMGVLALGGRVLAFIPVAAAAGAITLVVARHFYRKLGLSSLFFSRATAWELLRDGAPMLAIALAVAVQPYIDANLLYKLAPTNVVGWFGASWVIAGTLVAPATILGATLYPRLSTVTGDEREFRRTLRTGLRPLLLVAVLGAVGTYLFAHVAIGLIYSERQFGPAADILRAFTPALMLIYVDMLLGYAILALGKATQLAKAKVIAVLVTTGVELVLIPFFQSRVGNGGIGVVLAMMCGELVMVTSAMLLIRHVIDRGILFDFARALTAGILAILLFKALPQVTPFVGIPLCVVMFAALAMAVGLIGRADLAVVSSMLGRNRVMPATAKGSEGERAKG
jgi:O-antigen/teichoic acid export membrane protein